MAQFNAEAVAQSSEQRTGTGKERIEESVVPTGKYPVVVAKVDSYQKADDPSRYPDIRDPNKRRISIVTVYYKITDGEHKGEHIKQYLSMNHPSEAAMEISQSKMSFLCKATGVRGFRDHETGPFDALVGKQLTVRVEEKDGRDEFWEFLPKDAQPLTTQGGFAIAGGGDKHPAGRSDDW